MTIVITRQNFADCSQAEPVDRLLLDTSDGGKIYLAPTLDPTTEQVWFPVVFGPTRSPRLDDLLVSCRTTACGPVAAELVSLPGVGAAVKLRVSHQRHHEKPTTHDFKQKLTVSSLAVMTVHDLESLSLVP